ncbi:MAG: metal ABC transporter permease [Puniceicoccales bacterium]|jgi:ABC-type Mn2+/Zn2+ transport system permease subunit|nr:metal ABC transporter permease [Puniceicoccales bacterium]
MLEFAREILSPQFLFRHALAGTLLLGMTAPFAGCFLVARRQSFLGVTLPQVSSTGLASGLFLASFWHREGATHEIFALLGALVFTLATLFFLSWFAREKRSIGDAWQGALYIGAGAATVLLLSCNPHTGHGLNGILRGEIVSISSYEFWLGSPFLILPVGLLVLFSHEFALASYDPDFARAIGQCTVFWDTLLFILIGLIIATAVFMAGPLVCFGMMLLPALGGRLQGRTLGQIFLISALLGIIAALGGFLAAYKLDLPTGPTIIVCEFALLALSFGIHLARGNFA